MLRSMQLRCCITQHGRLIGVVSDNDEEIKETAVRRTREGGGIVSEWAHLERMGYRIVPVQLSWCVA